MGDQSETTISTNELFQILRLIESSDWDRIELTTKEFKLMVGKSLPPDNKNSSSIPFRSSSVEEGKAHASEEPKAEIVNVDSRSQIGAQSNHLSQSNAYIDGKVIYAPMMGIFYRAPKPGAPPFVEVGDTVTEHTIIGIIEVMKVMSSVEAGVKGRVSSILVENGQLVEYNQPLMIIKPEE